MLKKRTIYVGFLAVLVCFSSFIYFEGVLDKIDPVILPESSEIFDEEIITDIEIEDKAIVVPADPSTNTSGTYKTVGYFTQDNFVDLDENGNVFEWEKYDDVKDDSTNFYDINFFLDNASSNPDLRWHPLDTYDQAQSMSIVYGDYINSTVFTPAFTIDTYIQGNVYFMNAGETWRSAYSNWTLRVTLELFNPSTGQTSFITQASGEFDDTNEYVGSYLNGSNSAYQGMIYEGVIPTTTLIPSGYRLRATYEAMLGSASYNNDSERLELRSGGPGEGSTFYATQWNIDSTNDTFDNFYYIENGFESIGMQLYMYQENYPTIELTDLVNNTLYNQAINGTVTTSSDTIFSRYKWDSDPFTAANSPFTVTLPDVSGWHTLTVEAYDFYDNLATAVYNIGYKSSIAILDSPANNSLVTDGQYLNFSVYDVIFTTFEWDKDSTQILFLAPYDLLLDEGFNGIHQLTIHVNDEFGETLTEFFFDFDNIAPIISLDNVANYTTQAQGKNIDLEITDRSYPIDVQYEWDGDDFAEMTNIGGDIYRTYLPSTPGWHYLTVQATDAFSYSSTEVYAFNTSLTLLNVELLYMVNNSFYQGGEDVEVTIINHNGTVKFFWDNDPWSDGIVEDYVLTLNETNALSNAPGTYYLTIIVGDAQDVQKEFVFIFKVDQENPTIVQPITEPDYNSSRFLDSEILSFTINDNWTTINDLEILLSINGDDNQTFTSPFDVYLNNLEDGLHNLTIIAEDLAGNTYRYFISFTIDTTRPSTTVTISGQYILPDSSRYVPANSLVSVIVVDDDPNVKSYYSWNNSAYQLFVDSFTLPAIEGYAALRVLANDTLGNYRLRTYWLTIDATAPTIELLNIGNETKINDITPLRFKVYDLSDETILEVTSKWDLETSSATRSTDFTLSLLLGHLTETQATIELNATDIVGNLYSCLYLFYLDFEAPNYDLLNPTNESFVNGGTIIDFNVTSTDLVVFRYRWDYTEYQTAIDPWDILAPIIDGDHILEIQLEDDVGGGLYPNINYQTFLFTVDDIAVEYLNPLDFADNYYYTMKYGEEFTFSVNITDSLNNTIIPDLNFAYISEDIDLNLMVDNENTSSVWSITVTATNITAGIYSYIEFQFYQFAGNRQTITVFFKIDKQEGAMHLIDSSDSIIYGEDINLTVQLKDDLDVSSKEIIFLSINDNSIDVTHIEIDIVNHIYEITFDSEDFFTQKGNQSFELYVESEFYFGVLNESNLIEINILAIPITLGVAVSGVEVIYGTELVVTATLLQFDSVPISFETLTASFIVYYKDGSSETLNRTTQTNAQGNATFSLEITDNMDYIIVKVSYNGSLIYDSIVSTFAENIYATKSGIETWLIYVIAGGSLFFVIATALVVSRLVRTKPFDQLMEKVTEVDISENMAKMSPGVILSIFDQTKGPIPLIQNQSFDNEKYSRRMRIGVDNFLLKISDQAYSSLGFEEHDQRRRIGSINLPNEDMIGFIHGIQLENKTVRGGFENLSLIVLADVEFGGFLLANQEFMFPEIDELIFALRSKKAISEIEEYLAEIRKKSVIIMITASKNQKKDKKDLEQYK
ncbi:MAG: hypothetical protein FK730_02740 [Asgard group archaeon]|nr:hypothetical protein [Asgard group archaeon]